MRTTLLVAFLVLASTLAWTPSAQAAEPFLTDPANDTKLSTGFLGQSQPFDHEQVAAADLLGLEVVEELDTITFQLAVRSLAVRHVQTEYEISFGRADFTYVVRSQPFFGSASGEYATYLVRITEGEEYYMYEYVARLDTTIDVAASTLTTSVPKAYLLDGDGKAPRRGDRLTDVRVQATGEALFSSFILGFTDHMPDSGNGVPFVLEAGAFANGHLSLDSLDPFRVSNGGSTTFVLVATLRNAAPLDDDVQILVEDLPEGWDAKVASRQFLPASSEVPVTVLVSLPFAHDHGGVSSFNLTAKSSLKPGTYTTMKMGVLHTPIPQPAGHHDTLYFHSPVAEVDGVTFGGGRDLTMNTEMEGPNDAEEVAPRTQNLNAQGTTYRWLVPLNPGLQMGLDFDLDRLGELVAVMVPRVPGDVSVTANVWVTRPDGDPVLVAEGASAAQPGQANAPVEFRVPITPLAEGDYIPYLRGQNMVLELLLHSAASTLICCDASVSPTLRIQESSLKLPLDEYRDLVTTVEATGPRLALSTGDPLEKKARAGSTMTFVFNVTNNGEDDTFVAEVAGSDADAGAIVPTGSFQLAKGETRRVTLAVQVPFESAAGDQLEVILLVRSQPNPSNMAIARTYTTVTTGADAAPDELQRLQAAQNEERDTPGAGLGLTVATLLGAASIAARRRRDA